MAAMQKADPRARRTALVLVAAGTLAGVLLFAIAGSARPVFEAWISADLGARSRLVAGVMAVFTAVPAIVMSVYLWRLSTGTLTSERYPPPGLRVVHDTPIVTGAAAVRRARWLRILAVVLGAAGVLLGVLLWWLLSRLASAAGA